MEKSKSQIRPGLLIGNLKSRPCCLSTIRNKLLFIITIIFVIVLFGCDLSKITKVSAVDKKGIEYYRGQYGEGELILLPEDEYKKAQQNFILLDISEVANMGFKDETDGDGKGGWTDQGANDMRGFAVKGEIEFLKIPFNIIDPAKNNGKSSIVLRGQNYKSFPTRVEIPVGQKAKGIYFLHSAAWSAGLVGTYTIVYADGSKRAIELRDGHEIFNWWG